MVGSIAKRAMSVPIRLAAGPAVGYGWSSWTGGVLGLRDRSVLTCWEVLRAAMRTGSHSGENGGGVAQVGVDEVVDGGAVPEGGREDVDAFGGAFLADDLGAEQLAGASFGNELDADRFCAGVPPTRPTTRCRRTRPGRRPARRPRHGFAAATRTDAIPTAARRPTPAGRASAEPGWRTRRCRRKTPRHSSPHPVLSSHRRVGRPGRVRRSRQRRAVPTHAPAGVDARQGRQSRYQAFVSQCCLSPRMPSSIAGPRVPASSSGVISVL